MVPIGVETFELISWYQQVGVLFVCRYIDVPLAFLDTRVNSDLRLAHVAQTRKHHEPVIAHSVYFDVIRGLSVKHDLVTILSGRLHQ